MHNARSQFRDAIESASLNLPDVIEAVARLHRFPSNGKRGDDSGWYVLHGDGLPAGAFGNWRTGLSETWCGKGERTLMDAEKRVQRERLEKAKHESEAKRQQTHAEARDADGMLHTLEFIHPDPRDGDNKRFLPGGEKSGHYFAIGKPDGVLCIAEGYATGASIHKATDHAVAIAFDAGNLEPVAKALRAKLPKVQIIVAADNDFDGERNIGIEKARTAAEAVGGLVAIPAGASSMVGYP